MDLLPNDVVRYIASNHLDYYDVIKLSQTCKQIRLILWTSKSVWHALWSRFLSQSRSPPDYCRERVQTFYNMAHKTIDDQLIVACNHGYELVVKANLQKVFYMTLKDGLMSNMISQVVFKGYTDIYLMLAHNTVMCDDTVWRHYFLARTNVIQAVHGEHLEMVKCVLENGYSHEEDDPEDADPSEHLRQAVRTAFNYWFEDNCDNETIPTFLLERYPQYLTKDSITPNLTTAIKRRPYHARFLRRHGAEVTQAHLDFCLGGYYNHIDHLQAMVDYLLDECGCNIKAVTTLHEENIDIIPYLVERGAPLTNFIQYFSTAIAREKDHLFRMFLDVLPLDKTTLAHALDGLQSIEIRRGGVTKHLKEWAKIVIDEIATRGGNWNIFTTKELKAYSGWFRQLLWKPRGRT